MTPEEWGRSLFPTVLSPQTGKMVLRGPSLTDIAAALRAYGDERAAQARRACAQLAKNWEPEAFPGLDYPPGDIAAGIAAAILASKES